MLPKKTGAVDKGLQFICCDYTDIPIGMFNEKVIYCDPPYANSQQYGKEKFDSEKFWNWVRKISYMGYYVFISEREAPNDFECIWEGKVQQMLNHNTRTEFDTEKLFVLKNGAVANLINKGVL